MHAYAAQRVRFAVEHESVVAVQAEEAEAHLGARDVAADPDFDGVEIRVADAVPKVRAVQRDVRANGRALAGRYREALALAPDHAAGGVPQEDGRADRFRARRGIDDPCLQSGLRSFGRDRRLRQVQAVRAIGGRA